MFHYYQGGAWCTNPGCNDRGDIGLPCLTCGKKIRRRGPSAREECGLDRIMGVRDPTETPSPPPMDIYHVDREDGPSRHTDSDASQSRRSHLAQQPYRTHAQWQNNSYEETANTYQAPHIAGQQSTRTPAYYNEAGSLQGPNHLDLPDFGAAPNTSFDQLTQQDEGEDVVPEPSEAAIRRAQWRASSASGGLSRPTRPDQADSFGSEPAVRELVRAPCINEHCRRWGSPNLSCVCGARYSIPDGHIFGRSRYLRCRRPGCDSYRTVDDLCTECDYDHRDRELIACHREGCGGEGFHKSTCNKCRRRIQARRCPLATCHGFRDIRGQCTRCKREVYDHGRVMKTIYQCPGLPFSGGCSGTVSHRERCSVCSRFFDYTRDNRKQ